MKIKNYIFYFSLLLLFCGLVPSAKASLDSLGIKTIEGKKYIVHKLEAKETLYALGRRYHVSVAEIQNANPQEKDGYQIDQIGRELLIPYKSEEFDESETTAQKPSVSTGSKSQKHTVKAGETLYSIANKYKVSQDDIKKWNGLQSSSLGINQELWVSDPNHFPKTGKKEKKEKRDKGTTKVSSDKLTHTVDLGETIYSISRKYDVKQSEIIEINDLKDNNISVGQVLIIKDGLSSEKEEMVEEKEEEKPQYQAPSVQTFHNARKGETYETIAKMYGLTESKLKRWNKFKDPFVGGEVVKIVGPEIEKEKSADIVKKTEEKVDKNRIHTVESGETLYSLSAKYKVDVEDLRKWNSLSNYQLSLGQKLYIQNPDALFSDNKDDSKDVIDAAKDNEEIVEKAKVIKSENPQKQDTKAFFTVEEDDMPKIEKVIENGVAEVIKDSDGTEKYLALHRTAKIGTIMQVRNDLNDQIVFVRVLGKLPDTGVDKKVVIKISKKAFEKLGGVDYKFPVEISYLPLKD